MTNQHNGTSNNKAAIGLIVALALAVIAALTNPSREQHLEWRLKADRGMMTSAEADARSTYHNYVLFSTTTDGLGGETVTTGYFGGVHSAL